MRLHRPPPPPLRDNVSVSVCVMFHAWLLVCKCVFVCVILSSRFPSFLPSLSLSPSQAWEAVVGEISHSRPVCVCVGRCV